MLLAGRTARMALQEKQKFMKCIAAMDLKRGIGKNNDIPWNLKKEMAYFTRITSSVQNPGKLNAVVMGRKTWESIPTKYKPLSDRLNVILSKTLSSNDVPEGVLVEKSIEEVLKRISSLENIEDIFIIGGTSLYEEAIKSQKCDRIYLTHIQEEFGCDTFFPEFDETVYKATSIPGIPEDLQEEKGITYKFCVYQRSQEA